MRKVTLLLLFVLGVGYAIAQESATNGLLVKNTADKLLEKDSKLQIGGYGEVQYFQPIDDEVYKQGKLDVTRMVLFFGYNFNSRTQFISEIEFEHVKELWVEQAFLQYKLNNYISLRGGLLLVPMGIINEYHEPTTFLGVSRPYIDRTIAPTTWREIGIGAAGGYVPAALKYQLYIVNGFNGFDTDAKFNAKNGLRDGRQRGAESYMTTPNVTGMVEYYGIKGLNLGLSGYFGKSQSKAYEGVAKDDAQKVATADSTVIGISMVGLDARYVNGGLQLRGQGYFTSLSNTDQYNSYSKNTVKSGNEIGSQMVGYYLEAGYNVLRFIKGTEKELVPFVRYEKYDTQHAVESNTVKNDANDIKAVVAGLNFKLSAGAVVKADMSFVKSEAATDWTKSVNLGIGVTF